MARKHTIEQLQLRKHILEERTDKENYNIIKKIDRNIAKLAREKIHRVSGTPIIVELGGSNKPVKICFEGKSLETVDFNTFFDNMIFSN